MNQIAARELFDRRMIRPAVSVDLPLAPSLVRRRIQLYLAMVLSDGLSILTGFVISAWAYREHASLSE